MNPMMDLLILTGFLSAVFCVLGIVAGLCEQGEKYARKLLGRFSESSETTERAAALAVASPGRKAQPLAQAAANARRGLVSAARGSEQRRKAA